jgi:hypothetical protein
VPKALLLHASLESIHAQAEALARDIASRNAEVVARARIQLGDRELPLTQQDAQLVVAREYGFAGWQDLEREVLKRTENTLEWAGAEAKRAIHDNNAQRLKELLLQYPALPSWRDDCRADLLHATLSFAFDTSDAAREQIYNRQACTVLLIDAGAPIGPSVWARVINTRAAGMLKLLWDKGVLPHTLPVLAALGDLDLLRACFDESGALRASAHLSNADDLTAVNDAFMNACGFKHERVALFLLERCIALDHDLGRRIDEWGDSAAFIKYLSAHSLELGNHGTDMPPIAPWQAFAMRQIVHAMDENDLPAFGRWLQTDRYLLGHSWLGFQVMLLERAAFKNREPFMAHLLNLNPAVLKHRPPPEASALIYALEYGNAHLVSLLTRIWPLPDDLPHAAGMGDFKRVERWFDEAGQPALGDPRNHYPGNNPQVRANLQLGAANVQQILDVALAWACMNRQPQIASFLLEHGANINTRWGTHEPASILHECAVQNNFEAARFLVEHGIDLTIQDYRYNATAEGWARYAAGNEPLADFLAAAKRTRDGNSSSANAESSSLPDKTAN